MVSFDHEHQALEFVKNLTTVLVIDRLYDDRPATTIMVTIAGFYNNAEYANFSITVDITMAQTCEVLDKLEDLLAGFEYDRFDIHVAPEEK